MAIEEGDIFYFHGRGYDLSTGGWGTPADGGTSFMVQLSAAGALKSTTTLDPHALVGSAYDIGRVDGCTSDGANLYFVMRGFVGNPTTDAQTDFFGVGDTGYAIVKIAPDLSATSQVLATITYGGVFGEYTGANEFGLTGIIRIGSPCALDGGTLVLHAVNYETLQFYIVHLDSDFSVISVDPLPDSSPFGSVAGFDDHRALMLGQINEPPYEWVIDLVNILDYTRRRIFSTENVILGATVIRATHEIVIGVLHGNEFDGYDDLSIVRHNGEGPENPVYTIGSQEFLFSHPLGDLRCSPDGQRLYAMTGFYPGEAATLRVVDGPLNGSLSSIYDLLVSLPDNFQPFQCGPVVVTAPAGPVTDVAAAGRFCAVL